jgi:serine/threonine protein phosphatase PrpC
MKFENNAAINLPSQPKRKRELPTPEWKKKSVKPTKDVAPSALDYDDDNEVTQIRKRISKLEEVSSRESGPKFVIGAATEASSEHPERNEDAFYKSEKRGIIAVGDGMGGVPAGDLASHEAMRQLGREEIDEALTNSKTTNEKKTAGLIKKVFDSPKDSIQNKGEVESAVNAMLLRMNDEVEKLGQTNAIVREKAEEFFTNKMGKFDPNNTEQQELMKKLLQTIGCTMSLMKTWKNEKGENMMTVGNIGDSRIYRLRHGMLERLTRDDSHVQILLEEGLFKNDQDVTERVEKAKIIALADKRPELRSLAIQLTLKPDTVVTLGSIRNMVTQAAGLKTISKNELDVDFKPFVHSYDVLDGDALIAVSDGISDNLFDEEIRSIAATHFENPETIAVELQRAATKRAREGKKKNIRAKSDDATAVTAVFLGE